MENITLFTDASFCPYTKAAGGGYWAKYDHNLKLSGSFVIPEAGQSHEAEIMAAVRAIYTLLKHDKFGLILNGRMVRLILVVDCLAIKQILELRRVKCSTIVRESVDFILGIINDRGIMLIINHVKGHSGKQTPRNWVNDHCDSLAREAMQRRKRAIIRSMKRKRKRKPKK